MRVKMWTVPILSLAWIHGLPLTGEDVPGFKHHPQAELLAKAKELPGKVETNKPAFVILENSGTTLTALIYRGATGEAEVHEKMGDFFVVRAGTATLVIGGQLFEPRATAPGEFVATHIVGGDRREIAVGDIVHIPPKAPHQLIIPAGQSLTYVIVKVKE